MTCHALAIDDSPDVLEDVGDRLEALGHTCDAVTCMQCARERLAAESYAYILLDLEIPTRYGRPSRVNNGQALLREVRGMAGHAVVPIIVMTTHGHDSPDLAVDVLRKGGADDFVKKPFPEMGKTLEKAIEDVLAGRSRLGPAGKKVALATPDGEAQPFEQGELVFFEDRVELCGVKVCGGPASGMIRGILDQLRQTNSRGGYRRFAGEELAKIVGCQRGQNGVAEAIRAFRHRVSDVMLADANIEIDRLGDVIVNDRRSGYRFAPKIVVRDGHGQPNGNEGPDEAGLRNVTEDLDVDNERQRWVLQRVAVGEAVRKTNLRDRFGVSDSTAERDLKALRRRGLIEFVGPSRTGHWVAAGGRGELSGLPV